MEISTRDNQLVVKHNRLIESKHAQLTAREKKLLCLVMAQIAKDDDTFKLYKIPAHEIKQVLDLDSGDFYKQLKDVASKLDKRRVFIEDVKAKNWQILHFVSTVRYQDGYLYIQLHQELAPFLLKLYKDYTAYELKNVLMLTSSHAITIYEWLKKWVKIGKKEISVFELQEKLGVHENKSYTDYGQFKRRVLEPSIKEINEKSDLTFNYETKKERQKIISLIFHIQLKNQDETIVRTVEPLQTLIEIEEPVIDPIREKLIENLSPWFHQIQAESIIDEFNSDEKRINAGIQFFYAEQKAGKKIDKPGGFIYTAIKNGCGLLSPAQEKAQFEKQLKQEAEEKANKEKLEKEAKAKEDSKKAWAEFEAMPEDEKAILIGQLLSNEGEIVRNQYKKNGLQSMMIKTKITTFIKHSWNTEK